MLGMMQSIELMLRVLDWNDRSRKGSAPEPHRFPWEPKPAPMFEFDAMSVDEAMDWLGWSREMREHQEGGG